MNRYAFEPDSLHEIALRHVDKAPQEIATDLEADFCDAFGPLIQTDMPWLIQPAGFAMYHVKFLFAAMNEYVALMGIPIPSTGHSGRGRVTYWDTVLSGSMEGFVPGMHFAFPTKTGNRTVTQPLEPNAFVVRDHVFFLEYARGPLLTIEPFGLANHIFSTLDFKTAYLQLKVHATLAWRSRNAPRPYTDVVRNKTP
jgi:C-8 sterol isomerase